MKTFSPSFQPHLQLAHDYWLRCLQPGDSAIDATCGNGHDTLQLCRLILQEEMGYVYAMDIQNQALVETHARLKKQLSPNQLTRVHLINTCHSTFSELPLEEGMPIRLIVYNLGYLPGADKTKTTVVQTTLQSVQYACRLLASGGMISLTCYPGHPAGATEEEALVDFASSLPRTDWSCCHHRWVNRQRAPSLLLLHKR